MAVDAALVERLDGSLTADLRKNGRLGKPKRYLAGDHDLPYMPKGAKREYKQLAEGSITNWTPLVSDTFAKALFVDGYRPARATDNATPWRYWQANGLDARQTIVHRGALEYGTSYTLVLPGKAGTDAVPFMRPLDPLRSLAWYEDEDDEFPEIAYRRKGKAADGTEIVEVFDKTHVYTYTKDADSGLWSRRADEEHNLGVTPFVRFRDRLSGEATGIVRPIIPLQDRVNMVVFSTMIAMQYASFRQRWATGLAIPEDEEGNPVEPFQAAVDRLWVAEDDTARFGDFAQTELSGHHTAYETTVKSMAAISQISPNLLTGDLVNLSAEALASLKDSTQSKLGEYETLFGESWESGFRLAAKAAGDAEAARDTSAEVRWRDTEARALKDTVEGLGTLAEKLQVPVEALWEKVPGVTDREVDFWRSLRDSEDVLGSIVSEVQRQTAAANPQALAGTTSGVVPIAGTPSA